MKFYKHLMVLGLGSTLLLACGDDETPMGDPPDDQPPECTAEGDHTFVANKVIVPANPNEARNIYGFDLDGDDVADNNIGASLASLSTIGISDSVDSAVSQGEVILLLNLKAADLSAADCAEVSVYLGANPDPAPCENEQDEACGKHLDGNGSFDIDPESPKDAVIRGRITSGAFVRGPNDAPGEVTISLSVIEGAPPLTLKLIGAQMAIDQVSDTGLMQGRLGGAVPVEDLENSVLPTLYTLLDDFVTTDCTLGEPDCCEEGSTGGTILGLFNTDDDCVISQEEFNMSDLISLLFGADLDLLDANGEFAPNSDMQKDSVSLGIGFEATTATFQVP